ncbi:MAG: hypothetical protein IKL88_05220 [Erysipelotrichales bacterium]|nr:hypothetical protein [Erysipelotrichales bacterium]
MNTCDIQRSIGILRSARILSSTTAPKTLFLMIEGKIQVITVDARYTISVDDFLELYKDMQFIVLESENTDIEAALAKDAEYYSWHHK